MDLPPIPALLEALGNAAGWTVAVTILLIAAWGFYRGWWVPGHVYQREVERGDRAESAVEASTKVTQQAASATETAANAAIAVSGQLAELQRAIRRSQRAK